MNKMTYIGEISRYYGQSVKVKAKRTKDWIEVADITFEDGHTMTVETKFLQEIKENHQGKCPFCEIPCGYDWCSYK